MGMEQSVRTATCLWPSCLKPHAPMQEVSTTEAARDLRALLRLLGHVTQRDLAEGGGGGGGVSAATAANAQHSQTLLDTAQVCLYGHCIGMPLHRYGAAEVCLYGHCTGAGGRKGERGTMRRGGRRDLVGRSNI